MKNSELYQKGYNKKVEKMIDFLKQWFEIVYVFVFTVGGIVSILFIFYFLEEHKYLLSLIMFIISTLAFTFVFNMPMILK